MINKKEAKSKIYRLIGLVSALLLLATVSFVGSSGADIVLAPFSVNTSAGLADAIAQLDNRDYVHINLADNFELAEKDAKKIIAKLSTVFINGNNQKKLVVNFAGYTISMVKADKSVTMGGSGSVQLEITIPSNKLTVANVLTGDVTVALKKGSDTVKIENIHDVDVSLEQIRGGDGDSYLSISKTVSNRDSAIGILTINGESFKIHSVAVNKQPIYVVADVSDKSFEITPVETSEIAWSAEIADGAFKGTVEDFYLTGKYDSSINGEGHMCGTITYTPNGGSPAEIKLSNIEGTYGDEPSLSGAVILLDDNMKLTRHIPVPSFVDGAILNLNGHKLTIPSDKKILTKTPAHKVILTSTGEFSDVVADYTNFEPAEGFEWSNEKNSIMIASSKIQEIGKVVGISASMPIIIGEATYKPSVGSTWGQYRIDKILSSFELEPIDDEYAEDTTITITFDGTVSNPRVFHGESDNMEVLPLKSLGNNKYSFSITSTSPFTIAEATYVGGGSHSGGSHSSGGSHFLTETYVPTYTPTYGPTLTPTYTPTSYFPVTQTTTPTQKSPMPVFGLLAGLGAAVFAGVVLRRK